MGVGNGAMALGNARLSLNDVTGNCITSGIMRFLGRGNTRGNVMGLNKGIGIFKGRCGINVVGPFSSRVLLAIGVGGLSTIADKVCRHYFRGSNALCRRVLSSDAKLPVSGRLTSMAILNRYSTRYSILSAIYVLLNRGSTGGLVGRASKCRTIFVGGSGDISISGNLGVGGDRVVCGWFRGFYFECCVVWGV